MTIHSSTIALPLLDGGNNFSRKCDRMGKNHVITEKQGSWRIIIMMGNGCVLLGVIRANII